MKILRTLVLILMLTACSQGFSTPYRITNDVDNVIRQLEYSGRHEIQIDVRDTTVSVDGFVSSAEEKNMVENAIYGVQGVRHVKNNLKVLEGSIVSNSDLAKRIRDRLKADPTIMNCTMEIEHKSSVLNLKGEVTNPLDRDRIYNVARELAPDLKIQNNLRVKVKELPSDADINQRVMNALRAEGISGLEGVLVDTEEGIVVFTGRVDNHRQIDHMLTIALMVEGVRSVRSDVKIGAN